MLEFRFDLFLLCRREEIGFIDSKKDWVLLEALPDLGCQLLLKGREIFLLCAVNEKKDEIRFADRLETAFDTDLLNEVFTSGDACGINETNQNTCKGDLFFKSISGRPSNLGDNSTIGSKQGIEEAGFASGGKAGEDDLGALSEEHTLFAGEE